MALTKANSSLKPVYLTEEECTKIKELIYDYRDNLAGGSDEYFNLMQSILKKLR